MSAANVLWLPLGELLVERGLLSNVQLELALGEQRRTGLRLGEVLVSMGYVSEAALARMLLEQVGLAAEPAPAAVAAEPEVEPPHTPEPAAETPVGVGGRAEERLVEPGASPAPTIATEVREPEPKPEPEPEPGHPEPLVAVVVAEPDSTPAPEPLVVVEAVAEPDPPPEPMIVRLDSPERERDRGRWWSRNGNKARVRELEKLLSDFEQRSREIEADITRVRATLRSMRDSHESV